MKDHHSYYAVAKRKPAKFFGMNGIRTHDLCDTSAVLTQIFIQNSSEPSETL